MMLDGQSIVDRKYITFDTEQEFNTQDQVQPNGVDVRVKNIYQVQGKASIPREGKAQADFIVRPVELKDGYWTMGYRQVCLFYVDFFETLSVPEGYCGILHTRSSLVRSGIDIMAGLWDTGWIGRLGGSMRIHSDVTIEYGSNLAQITLLKSNFRGHRYTGRYMGSDSQSAIIS